MVPPLARGTGSAKTAAHTGWALIAREGVTGAVPTYRVLCVVGSTISVDTMVGTGILRSQGALHYLSQRRARRAAAGMGEQLRRNPHAVSIGPLPLGAPTSPCATRRELLGGTAEDRFRAITASYVSRSSEVRRCDAAGTELWVVLRPGDPASRWIWPGADAHSVGLGWWLACMSAELRVRSGGPRRHVASWFSSPDFPTDLVNPGDTAFAVGVTPHVAALLASLLPGSAHVGATTDATHRQTADLAVALVNDDPDGASASTLRAAVRTARTVLG